MAHGVLDRLEFLDYDTEDNNCLLKKRFAK